jgi:hypothetical protein
MNKLQQEQLLSKLPINGLRKVSETKYECFCVDGRCGNSHGEKRRKAGFFWSTKRNEYIFHCFKCGLAKSLTNFVKEYFKDEYIQNFFNPTLNFKEQSKNDYSEIKISNKKIKEFVDCLFEEKLLIPIKECKDIETIEYIESRKIPQNKLKYLYYTENFHFISQQIKELKTGVEQSILKDIDKRLVWFFKDRTNNVIAIQGRAIDKNEKKRYMIVRFTEDDNVLIGGFENADLSENLYVVEGYIDSLFLPNCVSLNGLHLPTIQYLLEKMKVKNITVIFDNEPMNLQIQKNIDSLVELSFKYEGLKVCLLPKYLRKTGKDINDYIKSGMSIESLIEIINNNSYDKATLRVKSIFWK